MFIPENPEAADKKMIPLHRKGDLFYYLYVFVMQQHQPLRFLQSVPVLHPLRHPG